jgi:hypothetical protein
LRLEEAGFIGPGSLSASRMDALDKGEGWLRNAGLSLSSTACRPSFLLPKTIDSLRGAFLDFARVQTLPECSRGLSSHLYRPRGEGVPVRGRRIEDPRSVGKSKSIREAAREAERFVGRIEGRGSAAA